MNIRLSDGGLAEAQAGQYGEIGTDHIGFARFAQPCALLHDFAEDVEVCAPRQHAYQTAAPVL